MTAKEINMATSFAHTIITIKTPTQQQCLATESTQHNQLSVSHNTHKNTFCVAAQLMHSRSLTIQWIQKNHFLDDIQGGGETMSCFYPGSHEQHWIKFVQRGSV